VLVLGKDVEGGQEWVGGESAPTFSNTPGGPLLAFHPKVDGGDLVPRVRTASVRSSGRLELKGRPGPPGPRGRAGSRFCR